MTFVDLDLAEYAASSAVALGRRIAAGELSPVHLVECALAVANREEPAVNAYAALMPERARSIAVQREAEARAGLLRSVIHGVPIAAKDNMYIEGQPCWKGSLTTSDDPVTESSPMVARLEEAGTVIIGRATTPEFGWKGAGNSPRTGVTRNPWNTACNTGGSSAGSGATVATGAVPIATGTDAGGSIRIPASFCGAVGFKPTLGAIPVWPGTVNENLSHAGPLTRFVDDAAAVFGLTCGPDSRDPQSAFSIRVPVDPAARLRVGVVREPFGVPPGAEVAEVFDAAIRLLTDAGVAELTEITLDRAAPLEIFDGLWVTGRGLGFAEVIRAHRDVMDPGLARLAILAEDYSLADFFAVTQQRRAFNEWAFGLFDRWDLLVMPTMPLTAFAAEAEVPSGGHADAPLPWATWTPYTYPFNISGQPALSLPIGLSNRDLPVGLQIVGPWSADLQVLSFAGRCESALAPLNPRRTAPSTGV
ncbi:amidase [Mycolicibacterium diernhoferi]|uniref:amidase n=1 Tax=Mycolicibacterium diernhoferi TaxID=1801 RepID=A0A2A7NPB9_9MYCO|nr:amidase family protein [Mycolicibacterium diernhoferi]PEG52439.1 amidase [Mycolicibacterium diernhoferi]QYL20791.1 amidase [Mycolicibacterium diernhoferi]